MPRPRILGARPAERPTLTATALAARPFSLALTAALRRVARRDPAAFERLGPFQSTAYLIEPEGAPVAFRLEPAGVHGRVTLVARGSGGPAVARVRGPLAQLLVLLDGGLDADAAFFGRTLSIEGSTEAVVALHNALEAADLGLADLLPGPLFARRRFGEAVSGALRRQMARAA